MREHKFRGKSLETGEWVIGSYIDKSTLGQYIVVNGVFNIVMVDPKTVGEYISRQDRRGNEIYEDDIVQLEEIHDYTDDCYYNNIRQMCGNRIIKLVKWMSFTKYSRGLVYYEPPEFRIEDIKIKESNCCNFYSYDGELFSWEDLEIIGNKFDNPELVEVS